MASSFAQTSSVISILSLPHPIPQVNEVGKNDAVGYEVKFLDRSLLIKLDVVPLSTIRKMILHREILKKLECFGFIFLNKIRIFSEFNSSELCFWISVQLLVQSRSV